jgi:ADP-heptose:LPS heptosyltransferase
MDIIFKQWQAPGDLLMLTVAIRDLHKIYPGKFRTDVFTCYPEVFFNNPYLIYFPKNNSVPIVNLNYAKVRDQIAPKGYHFSDAFICVLNDMYNILIKKTSMKPDIHLTFDEKTERILERLEIKKPYWIINTGVKSDIPIKGYPPNLWQKVIDGLSKKGIRLVQVGSKNDIHPIHNNIYKTVVGQTENLRDFFSLVLHSQGTIGHVSLHMHVAAAFNKPCVVVAGGREDPNWERYPDHRYLHTVGKLDCCKTRGCWISQAYDCLDRWKGRPYGRCIAMIEPDQIIDNVLSYNV